MISSTSLRVACDDHCVTRVTHLRAEPPQLVRVTDTGGPSRPVVAHLCGGAAGPLGGDWSTFDLTVGTDARLTIRSVAATLIHPGPTGASSRTEVRATVAVDARLDWWPEPLVAIKGCDHHLDCTIEIARGAHVRWVDEIVRGRAGEDGGRIVLRQRVLLDGCVLTAQEIDVTSRVVATAFEVGPTVARRTLPIVTADVRAAVMQPAPGLTVWTAVGTRHEAVRAALAQLGLARDTDTPGKPARQ